MLGSKAAPPTSDAVLLARVQARGDDAALAEAELCARYQRRILLYGLKHTRDEALAADLVQDVLETLIQKARAGQVLDPEQLGSFVLGTCRLLVRNQQRTSARRGKILAQYPDLREGVAEASGERTDLARVEQCLASLSARERSVLMLSYYAELDAAAIARECGLSAANVRVLRHRAIERMQVCVHAARPSPRSDA